MNKQTKCVRCGEIEESRPKGKGLRNTISLSRTTHTHTSKLRLNHWRFTPWTENPADQVQMFYSEVALCSLCAVAVWDYAQVPIPAKTVTP